MFKVVNSTWTVWVGGTTASDPRTISSPGYVHRPAQWQTCEQSDRAADEQIAGLVADLRAPCPHCGRGREECDDA